MKRVKILPAPNGAPPAKKDCVPIMHIIPIDNLTASNPIIIDNADSTVDTMNLQLEENITESENVVYSIIEHMDITEPLTSLRTLLESRLGVSLADYTFYLQDVQELDASRNLVKQCVQGEGMVQINVEVSEREGMKKINILDVLKPAEEIAIAMNSDGQGSDGSGDSSADLNFSDDSAQTAAAAVSPQPENITRWIAANDFLQLQNTLKIPNDPENWTTEHVRLWIRWAAARFMSCSINTANWKLDGKALLSLTREGFRKKVPIDPDDLFWTHLELLRKCKIVAVLQNPPPNPVKLPVKLKPKVTKPVGSRLNYDANNCQTQLWQFLLELLTDKDHRDHIQWVGTEGEFKLINPEMVAYLWGKRKNKPTMNYEKLSRALRYYYDGELIAKVHGKRFVYKFVYDLKKLLGYSAAELNKLVCEYEMKCLQADTAPSTSTSTSSMQFLTNTSTT